MFSGLLPKVVYDVGPGGSLVTSGQGVNALVKGNLENRYYAPIQQANAMSKLAYAQYAQPEAIAKFLSIPGVAENIGKEQYQQLQNQLQNSVSAGPYNPFAQNKNDKSIPMTLMSKFWDMIHPGDNSVPSPSQPVNSLLVGQTPSGMPIYGNPQQAAAASNLTPGNSVTMPGVPGSTINRIAQGVQTPGTQGGYNQPAVSRAQEAGLTATASGEASANNEMWKQMHSNGAQDSIAAQNTTDLANKFQNSYNELTNLEKRRGLGSLPAITTAATDADNAANQTAIQVARAAQVGHITDKDLDAFRSFKFSRSMPPDAVQHAVDFIKGMNERVQEHSVFNVQAQKLGLTPQEANAVWLNYIKKNPFYDSKNHELLEENFNKWPEYLSPENVQEALIPKPATVKKGSKGITFENNDPMGLR